MVLTGGRLGQVYNVRDTMRKTLHRKADYFEVSRLTGDPEINESLLRT